MTVNEIVLGDDTDVGGVKAVKCTQPRASPREIGHQINSLLADFFEAGANAVRPWCAVEQGQRAAREQEAGAQTETDHDQQLKARASRRERKRRWPNGRAASQSSQAMSPPPNASQAPRDVVT